MRTKFFAVICLLISGVGVLSLNAQQLNFKWGTANTKAYQNQNVPLKTLVGSDAYYIINTGNHKSTDLNSNITIEKYNWDNVLQFRTNITCANQYDYIGVFFVNNKPVVLSGLYRKENSSYSLVATAINTNSGTPEEEKSLINTSVERLSERGSFSIEQSMDKSKLAIIYQPAFKKNEQEKIVFYVLGIDFKVLWSSTQTFNYESTRYVTNIPYINNDGVFFVLKRLSGRGKTNNYTIFTISEKQPLKEFKIELDGKKKMINTLSTIVENGDFVVAGLYTEEGYVSFGGTKFEGSVVYKINATGTEKLFGKIVPFQEKIKDLQLTYLLTDKKKTILVSERKWINEVSKSRTNNSPSQLMIEPEKDITYYASDIVLNALNENGESIFTSTIKRSQNTLNDFGFINGVMAFVEKEKLVILFNDDITKHDGRKRIISFGSKKIPVVNTYDITTGKQEVINTILAEYGNPGDILIRPDFIIPISLGRYLVRSERAEFYKMGELIIK